MDASRLKPKVFVAPTFWHKPHGLNAMKGIEKEQKLKVSMRSMISRGDINKAIHLYKEYGYTRNTYCNAMFIKACTETKNFNDGNILINTLNIKDNVKQCSIELLTAVIKFYSANGHNKYAYKIFKSIPLFKVNEIVVFTIMNCLVKNKKYRWAVEIYDEYKPLINETDQIFGIYLKALYGCGGIDDVQYAVESLDETKANAKEYIRKILEFYVKIDYIDDAMKMFNKIKDVDVKSVSIMMQYYVNNHKYKEAMELYERFDSKSHDEVSNILYIRACGYDKNFEKANALISKLNVENCNKYSKAFIATLIDFYGMNGYMDKAQSIFESLSDTNKDAVCIAVMMKWYIHNNYHDKAVLLYESHKIYDHEQMNILYVKGCISLKKFDKCSGIISKINEDRCSIEFCAQLMKFHDQMGSTDKAINIYNKYKLRSEIIAAMMEIYIKNNEIENAIKIYEQYTGQHSMDSHAAYLHACIKNNDYTKGKKTIKIVESALNKDEDVDFITKIIEFHGNFKNIGAAKKLFDMMPNKNKTQQMVETMMNAYKMNYEYKSCVDLLYDLLSFRWKDGHEYSKIVINEHLFGVGIFCCVEMGAINNGEMIVEYLKKPEYQHIYQTSYVQSLIIALYAKCDKFDMAMDIFKNTDMNTLSAVDIMKLYVPVMNYYAKRSDQSNLMALYQELRQQNIQINSDIYCVLFSGCRNSGNVTTALNIFDEIKQEHSVIDDSIISSLIHSLASHDKLNDCELILDKYGQQLSMKYKIHTLIYMLSYAREYDNVSVAQNAFDQLIEIYKNNPNIKIDSSIYLLLSNVYSQNKDFQTAMKLRQETKYKGIDWTIGKSWIEIDSTIYEFCSNDSKNNEIYKSIENEKRKIRELLRNNGYSYNKNIIINKILNNNKNINDYTCSHTSQYALIYGIINNVDKILISTNLIICNDCYNQILLISKIYNNIIRQIYLKDLNKWHIFSNGLYNNFCN